MKGTSIIEMAVRNAFTPLYIEKEIYGAEKVLSDDLREPMIKRITAIMARQLASSSYCENN